MSKLLAFILILVFVASLAFSDDTPQWAITYSKTVVTATIIVVVATVIASFFKVFTDTGWRP